jgi:hypothetical protein
MRKLLSLLAPLLLALGAIISGAAPANAYLICGGSGAEYGCNVDLGDPGSSGSGGGIGCGYKGCYNALRVTQ